MLQPVALSGWQQRTLKTQRMLKTRGTNPKKVDKKEEKPPHKGYFDELRETMSRWQQSTLNTQDTDPKKVDGKEEERPPRKGYFEELREIMIMPLTSADPNIPTKRVTAKYCAQKFTAPPRNVTMLSSDFIDDSLYNPAYGYFSKQALIFSLREGYNFSSFRDSSAFMDVMGDQYKEIERELDDVRGITRQLWHTSTEIFKPWYGYAIAKHIAEQYMADRKANVHDDPLVVYEVGGGNGTLMLNILDYIRNNEPAVYSQMEYKLVEISPKLARQQLIKHGSNNFVHTNAKVINQSILDWSTLESRACFVVAMELLDNFPHDVVRYDYDTGEPYQGIVRVYDDSEYEDNYEPVTDPTIRSYLAARKQAAPEYKTPALPSDLHRRIRRQLPLAPNMTKIEFIPTHAFRFLQVLGKFFPRHRVVLGDFYMLPDTVPGAVDAPVVQTRLKGTMVPCDTYMVRPGWFDIFFPTNFELLRSMYNATCRAPSSTAAGMGRARVCTQAEFVKQYGDLSKTATRSGENPMLEFYGNNKFLLS
ncbi:hypothetical protein GGH12_004351 [Coemansia sp. RSA 1822]|nr:hypothetical protein IW147_003943 [Coemansia sp. RSA 720]KAJ2545347.1 hypothetical protein GGF49_000581 [Coemansia sp. RSA 1853]KAJ2561009.1 hypothetical protein GGH12_004351 [Coemansia sp. RSA 1822]